MTDSTLTAAQIAALLRFGVGVGSEGGANPGLGLAGWVVNGQGQFDASGNAINASSIIGNSGYTVGLLQTDFGQNGSGPAFSAFLAAFFDSPQGQSFSLSEQTAIRTSLLLTGQALEGTPSNMLNEVQFDAINSFLLTPAGVAAYGDLDQVIINATSPTGVNAADAVAESGGDLSAQEIAAAVAMKLYNQTGGSSSELSDFNTWLQNQTGVITIDSIQDWVADELLTDPVWTGLTNTIQATTTLDALQSSDNPMLQGIYQDLVSGSNAGASLDGLYDLGVRLLTVPSSVAASVMNAINSGTYYQGTSFSSFNSDGTLAAGSHGTIVGANGDVVIWNADGTAFVIQNGVSTQLSGLSAIQAQGQQSIAVSLPNGGSIALNNVATTAGADGQCFRAGTEILFSGGTTKPIEQIGHGDRVLAFADRGEINAPLRPARVTRLFRNITSEWLVLSCGLTVTPGHLFLNERGEFERIDALLARGGRIVLADGTLQAVTAERVVYSEATRQLYEEAEEVAAATAGALALAPHIKRGWRTYNFEVEGLHTYVAGGVRVHNDSLGDLIVAEDEYQQIYGAAFDPSNSTDVQQLAADIANGTIDGGSLATSIGSSGDLTALEQRLVSDDDQITDIVTDADGNATFTDSNGDEITLNPNRQEVSEVLPDGQGGTVTEIFGYSSNGTQVVATEQDIDSAGQTISNIVNTSDPTTGALLSSSETDYDSSGAETAAFTTDGNNNLTTYDAFNSDGSSTFFVYNGAGEVSSDTQYGANGGGVVAQQQFTYDSSGDLVTIATQDGAGDPVSFDAYNPDGSHVLTDFNSSDQPIEQTNYASDGQTVISSATLAYDSSGDLSTVVTYDGSGDLVSVDDYLADGSQALSQYNSAGALSTVTTTDSAGALVSLDAYAADGSHVLQTYDSAGQVIGQTSYASDGQTVVSIKTLTYDSSGDLAEIDTTDGAGDVLSADVYQPDGSHQLTTYNADGTDSISSFDSSGALSMTQNYDADGNLLSATGVSGLGVTWTETVSASGTSFTYGAQSVDDADAAIDGDLIVGGVANRRRRPALAQMKRAA